MIRGGQTPRFQRGWELHVIRGRGGMKGLARKVSFHLRAGRAPVQLLASFLTIQGGSDLCLAPVALQGLSHPVTSLISWPSPTISTLVLGREIRITLLMLGISRDSS